MKIARPCAAFLFALTAVFSASSFASDQIPKAAWKRAIGLPLENPGKEKASIPYPHIDDGYWQGAPVGGFGAGTLSRSYRGDFSRWHIKAGTHKYQPVHANQFSVYQKVEGSSQAVVQTLYAGKPEGENLSAWKWNYPVG